MVGRSVFGSRNEREKDDLIAVLREGRHDRHQRDGDALRLAGERGRR